MELSDKPVKVALRVHDDLLLEMREYATLDGKKEKRGYGFMQDVWNQIKDLGKFENAKVDYIEYGYPMTDLINEVNEGKYDFAIGNFSVTPKRVEKVSFTRPLYLNLQSVLYYPKESSLKKFSKVVIKTLMYPLLFLIIIGLLSGFILFFVDKKRGKKRAILSSLASMFGEMGNISERSNLTFMGMLVAFLIMLISYYVAVYLQAVTVGQISDANQIGEINRSTIKGKNLLVEKNFPYAPQLAEKGAIIHYKDMDKKELIKYYSKNQEKYDGVIMDYETAKNFQKDDDNFLISSNTLGWDEISIPVNPARPDLVEKLNQILEVMRENGQMIDACQEYFGEDDKYLCIV